MMKPTKRMSNRRRLTICRKRFGRCGGPNVQYPIITLSGKWLLLSGFRIGHVLDVASGYGTILITLAEEQKYVHP